MSLIPTATDDRQADRVVWWYDEEKPEVSIVILNYNKSELTQECLRRLWAHTYGRRYEIIVVDNGSTPEEFQKLASFPGSFHLVRLNVNRYFGEGNNIGVEASHGKYVIFLNNDAFVLDHWLGPLISVLESQPRAGGVGPTFRYLDGRMQEAGAFVDSNGHAIQRGKFYPLAEQDLEKIEVVDYCSAACFATTRAYFDRVSGFDPIFEPAYYEDVDLALKIASLGLLVYHCPHSVVHHIENGTASTFRQKLGLNNIVEINRQKFVARWGRYLTERETGKAAKFPSPPPLRTRPNGPASRDTPIAVFYSPYDLVPGGGERYLLTAACAARKTHRVYIATSARYSEYRLDYLGRELSLDLSHLSMTTLADLGKLGPVDLFVHMGNNALPLASALGRQNVYICQFPFPSGPEVTAEHWENLRNYDQVIVYSDFARKVLQERINSYQFRAPIAVIAPPVPIDTRRDTTATHLSQRSVILGIGRFFTGGHNKRHDVMIEALRRLVESGIDAELHLVGTLHTHAEHMAHYSRLCALAAGLPITFHANAAPAVVRDLLQRADYYWHAAGFDIDPALRPEICEHFGISILEAMAAGCLPFVVNNGGPVEFVREGETGYVYSTIDGLVAKTKAAIGNRDRSEGMRERAAAMALTFSEDAFMEKWGHVAQSASA